MHTIAEMNKEIEDYLRTTGQVQMELVDIENNEIVDVEMVGAEIIDVENEDVDVRMVDVEIVDVENEIVDVELNDENERDVKLRWMMAYTRLANYGLAAMEESWIGDWIRFAQKVRNNTATNSEFQTLDVLVCLKAGCKNKKKVEVARMTKQQIEACSQCFVCQSDLDQVFALPWKEGRVICVWCSQMDDEEKEEMRHIGLEDLEEDISIISLNLTGQDENNVDKADESQEPSQSSSQGIRDTDYLLRPKPKRMPRYHSRRLTKCFGEHDVFQQLMPFLDLRTAFKLSSSGHAFASMVSSSLGKCELKTPKLLCQLAMEQFVVFAFFEKLTVAAVQLRGIEPMYRFHKDEFRHAMELMGDIFLEGLCTHKRSHRTAVHVHMRRTFESDQWEDPGVGVIWHTANAPWFVSERRLENYGNCFPQVHLWKCFGEDYDEFIRHRVLHRRPVPIEP